MRTGAPSHFALTVCLWSVLPLPSAAATPASYDALVARAQADGLSVDYTVLRAAYAASDRDDPLGFSVDQNIGLMMKAMNARDCDKALESSEKVLKVSFINILA